MGVSPGPGAGDTSRGHLPRGGPVGGGAPLVARVSGLRQPRLREHEAGQARADVIGSAPRAPGQAGEGGHRAGRERGREGVARCRWPDKLEGWERVLAAIHPKTFPKLTARAEETRTAVTAKPPRSPAPCPLHELCPPPVQGPSTPRHARWAPDSRPLCPDFQFSRDPRPGANFCRQPRRKPSPLSLLLCLPPSLRRSAQIVRAVTLVGGQGPRGRRDYPGALPPSAHPLPLHVRRQRGTPRARCPRTRVGHEAPHARARTHARPQAGEALATARRHQAGTTAYLGMVEVQQ